MQPNQPLRAHGANRRNQSASRIPASRPGYPFPDHRYQPYMHDTRSWQSGHPSGMPTNHQVYAMPVSEAIPSWDMTTHDNSRVQPVQLTTYSPSSTISPQESHRSVPRSSPYGQLGAFNGAFPAPQEIPLWSETTITNDAMQTPYHSDSWISRPSYQPSITSQLNVMTGTSAMFPPTSSIYHSTPHNLVPSFSTPGAPPPIPALIPTPASNRSSPETTRRHKPTSKSIPCPDKGCQITFSRPQDVERHFKSVHCGQRHTCPGCTRSYTRSDALKRHQKEAGCGLDGN